MDAPEVLYYTIDQLKKLTSEELAHEEFRVNQYILYLREKINRQKMFFKWFESKSDELTSQIVQDTDPSLGWNARLLKARHSHPLAEFINKGIRSSSSIINDNENTTYDIIRIADCLKDLRFVAIAREKHGH